MGGKFGAGHSILFWFGRTRTISSALRRGREVCSTPHFSDHWLSLFPLTLSVSYENKKEERERLFAKIGRLEMELDW